MTNTTTTTTTEPTDTMTERPAPTMGSELVKAVESFWAAVARRHPELPAQVVVVTGSGRVTNGLIRGHWAIGRWTTEDDRLPELFISGERMGDGAEGVATTIIHEAAHALLQARGDLSGGTSRQGRYHTRKGFAAAAEELGLKAPEQADPVLGFSDCTMTPATAAEYAVEMAELEMALGGASIEHLTAARLAGLTIAIGLLMGGTQVLVPWWQGADPAAAWTAAGGLLVKPRKPRKARPKVVLACGCRSLTLEPSVAADLADLECSRCGEVLQ